MKTRDSFATRLGFTLACIGSAVGMGNLWMFPTRVSLYGGGSFLIPYFIFIILFGMVGLSAEFAVGRRAKTGTLGAYEYCWSKIGKGKLGYFLGYNFEVKLILDIFINVLLLSSIGNLNLKHWDKLN